MPRGPKTSSRFGELSQCSTSSTSWKIITVAIVLSPLFEAASGLERNRPGQDRQATKTLQHLDVIHQ
jgi:hypothetical protein